MLTDLKTKNKSFLDVREYLLMHGVTNNNFMLEIHNEDLIGVDPFDKTLSTEMKQAIMKESMTNFWYFIREIVRWPSVDGQEKLYERSRARTKQYRRYRRASQEIFDMGEDFSKWFILPRSNK